MPTRTARFYSFLLIFGDFLTLMAAFTLAYVVRVQLDPRPLIAEVYARDYLQTFLVVTPLWLIIFASLGLYTSLIYTRRLAELGRLFIGAFIGILIVIGYAYVRDDPVFPARLVAAYAFAGAFLLLFIERELLRQIRSLLFRFGIGISRVLIIGNSEATRDIIRQMSNTPKSGFDVVSSAGPQTIVPSDMRGTHYVSIDAALANLEADRITTIIQTDLYGAADKNQRILSAAQQRHIHYSFIPGEPEFYAGKNTVDVFLGYPIISVHQTPLIGWGEVVKRVVDLALVIGLSPIWVPLYLLVYLLQKIFNPGPALYVSRRLTRYSRPFKLYKFRSMRAQYGKRDAADEFRAMGREDLVQEYELRRKVTYDPRITAFGHFLRKTSLDELPQLLNVLIGDLSLVGPRPILPQEMKMAQNRGALLHSVKSGVTGLWQVSGRSELNFEQRIELELYYAQNWSLWLDIKILFKTLRVVLWRVGAR